MSKLASIAVCATVLAGSLVRAAPSAAEAVLNGPGEPSVAWLSADSAPAGATIEVAGTGLGEATRVAFGSNPASFSELTAEDLLVTVPAGTGTVAVIVTTPYGVSWPLYGDFFTYVAPPTLPPVPSPPPAVTTPPAAAVATASTSAAQPLAAKPKPKPKRRLVRTCKRRSRPPCRSTKRRRKARRTPRRTPSSY